MFFHIDEAGNTGNNLFDLNQPRLSYGVLSSLRNSDVLCKSIQRNIQKKIGKNQMHANELGFKGLVEIAPYLIDIQKKMKFDFDYFMIEKRDYALTMLFDAVFDAGLNEAVKWDTYWTPLRFLIIIKLNHLIDDELLCQSWSFFTDKNLKNRENEIIDLLAEIKNRTLSSRMDKRSIELISDALSFGISNPMSLGFEFTDKRMISPNIVAFQFVVTSIARRVRSKRRKNASSILVDRQQQFNSSQLKLHNILSTFADHMKAASKKEKIYIQKHPTFATLNPDDLTYLGLPDRELTTASSSDSLGLQIVDVYLWITNKMLNGEELPRELKYLLSLFIHRSGTDNISIHGMEQRFIEFEKMIPAQEDMTPSQWEIAYQSKMEHREKVEHLKKIGKLAG